MEINKKLIGESVIDEIRAAYECVGDMDSPVTVENIDLGNMKITLTFDLHIVEEDNYIGLVGY